MRALTDADYWEESWWSNRRPERLRWRYRDQDYEVLRLLHRAGGRGAPCVLEMGGGGSRILPYLGRKFGYKVFGTDFSPAGCRLLSSNLQLQGIHGSVLREDILHSSLAPETFDLVYSSGLIEHFDDRLAVAAEHLRLLKPGGRLVLIVPNLQGLQGEIYRRWAKPLWERHTVFGPDRLGRDLKELGLEDVRSGYLGSFFFHVGRGALWPAVMRWPPWIQSSVYWSVRLGNAALSLFFRLLPLRPHTRALSPAFFAAGVKRANRC